MPRPFFFSFFLKFVSVYFSNLFFDYYLYTVAWIITMIKGSIIGLCNILYGVCLDIREPVNIQVFWWIEVTNVSVSLRSLFTPSSQNERFVKFLLTSFEEEKKMRGCFRFSKKKSPAACARCTTKMVLKADTVGWCSRHVYNWRKWTSRSSECNFWKIQSPQHGLWWRRAGHLTVGLHVDLKILWSKSNRWWVFCLFVRLAVAGGLFICQGA